MTLSAIETYQKTEILPAVRHKTRELMVGVFAVSVALSGCVNESDPAPHPQVIERPAPTSDFYFHDVTDPFYGKVAKVLSLAKDPTSRANIEKILDTPIAEWLNTSAKNSAKIIEDNLELRAESGGIPMFVAYNIPFRDLGGDSRGGAADADAYREWVNVISATIANNSAVLILEPDALAGVPLMKDMDMRTERITLLREALRHFTENNPNMAVYLDVGHSKWHSADMTADLIKQVDQGDRLVQGLALNVSNQRPEEELRKYATRIWQHLGYKPYIMLDNSMNGAANTEELLDWCNVPGEKIGTPDDNYFDENEYFEEAYIKAPGESDGRCGTSDMAAGVFDNDLLLRQVAK